MTTNSIAPIVDYLEDGVTRTHAVPFKFRQADDLIVERVNLIAGTIVRLARGAEYTVTGAGNPNGGAIMKVDGGGTATLLRIRRFTARLQPMNYEANDTFPAESHEDALDRGIMIDQEQEATLADLLTRALLMPVGSRGYALPGAIARRGQVLGFNLITGDPEVQGAGAFKGDPGGTTMSIGLFEIAGGLNVPLGTDLVQTSGHARRGSGSARYAYDPAVDAAYVAQNQRSSFITANGRGFRLSEILIDIRMFGAIGDNQADDTDAILECFGYIDRNGGGTAIVSPGIYKTSRDLVLPGSVGLDGYGPSSCLRPNSCNGIVIARSDNIGPRRIANVFIYGNGGEAYAGIKCNLDSNPDRATGVIIENCYIAFFGTGMDIVGLWHATIRSNTINQVHVGIWLHKRTVKVAVYDNRVTRGGLIVNSGPSMGIMVGDDTPGLRPEDVQVRDNLFFNFQMGVHWRQVLFGSVTNNDFDYCTWAGIYIVTADGGTAFRDNWVQVDNPSGDCYGIYCSPLGSLPGVDNVVISNNRLRATDVQIIPGQFHSYGIFIGNNQANITAEDNSIQGAFQISLWSEGAQRVGFRNNKGVGATYLFNNNIISSDGNFWEGGITLSGNVNTNFGKDLGLRTTEIAGSVTVPAGATSVTATFASMNMADLPLGGYSIAAIATDRGNLTHGGIAVDPTISAITIYCEKAIASLPSTVDFRLNIY